MSDPRELATLPRVLGERRAARESHAEKFARREGGAVSESRAGKIELELEFGLGFGLESELGFALEFEPGLAI